MGLPLDSMIPGTSISKIYVLGSQQHEPDRIAYLTNYFQQHIVAVEYFQPTWKTTLQPQQTALFADSIQCDDGKRPFKAAEQSIFLNWWMLLSHIRLHFTAGYFCIFESDVRFESDLVQYFQLLEGFLRQTSPDCLSIGSGCDLIDDDVNTDDMNLQIAKKTVVRCTDSFVFSYSGVCRFLDWLDSKRLSGVPWNKPIDNIFQDFLEQTPDYTQYWVWPSLTLQGSQYGHYPTSIQDDAVQQSVQSVLGTGQTEACENQCSPHA